MKITAFVLLALLVLLCTAVSSFAHTGPLVNGEPAWTEVGIASIDGATTIHDETLNNPLNVYKGWWYVNLTNNTASAWSSISIAPGVGDLVALVQGSGLVDEWGFTGDSIVSNKAGTVSYSGVRGSGNRLYDNGVTGLLWGHAQVNFTTAVAVGQKVGLKIYTDNSWYNGPYATSFSLTLTPNAVPEPGSLLAFSSGLIGLAGLALKKRR